MNDHKQFDHFLKKCYEVLHLHFRHYLPLGKPEPLIYSDVLYELYKIYDSGSLEEMSKEPVIEEEVKQLDFLSALFEERATTMSVNGDGTLFDQPKSKTI